MKYISEREFNSKMRVIQRRNESIDRYNKLKDEKKKVSINIKKPTTDKLIAIYLFIILNVILVYSMISMWNFADLSSNQANNLNTYHYTHLHKPSISVFLQLPLHHSQGRYRKL